MCTAMADRHRVRYKHHCSIIGGSLVLQLQSVSRSPSMGSQAKHDFSR
jgi:hypothetical protein